MPLVSPMAEGRHRHAAARQRGLVGRARMMTAVLSIALTSCWAARPPLL